MTSYTVQILGDRVSIQGSHSRCYDMTLASRRRLANLLKRRAAEGSVYIEAFLNAYHVAPLAECLSIGWTQEGLENEWGLRRINPDNIEV